MLVAVAQEDTDLMVGVIGAYPAGSDSDFEVRAFAPAPGAWFEFLGERCKVLAAEVAKVSGSPGTVLDGQLTIACGTGAIRPTLVQRAGRPAMATADLLRGWQIGAGARLA